MKTFFLLITALPVFIGSSVAQTILWEAPVEVSNGSNGNAGPEIVLTDDGDPVVLWGEAGPDKVWLSAWTGTAFGPAVQVNTGGFASPVYDFGGIDLAAANGNLFIVFENYTHGILLVRSVDGGQTFEPAVHVYDLEPGLFATLATVVTDAGGNPVVSFILENDNETQGTYRTARSEDAGLTFQPVVTASEPADGDYVCECCSADLAVSGDTLWLAFRRNDTNLRDIWVSRSTDNGNTFDIATDVDNINWNSPVCPISGPKIARTGDNLITTWMSQFSGQARVHISSTDPVNMISTSQLTLPLSGTGNQNRPDIAISEAGIAVVWEETGIPGNTTDILMAYSETGVATLPDAIANVTQAPGIQRFPSIVYGAGAFHLVYADVVSGKVFYRRGTPGLVSNREIHGSKNQLEIYPNPAVQEIVITPPFSGDYTFSLYNWQGQLAYQALGEAVVGNKQSFDLGTLPVGIYMARFQGGKGVYLGNLLLAK